MKPPFCISEWRFLYSNEADPEMSDKRSGFPFPSAVQIVIKIDEDIGVVHDTVHCSRHDKSGGYIKDGMLFDKHGRQNNQYTQN